MEAKSHSASRVARSYLWSILIWMSLAPVDAAQNTITFHDPYWVQLLADGAWLLTAALLTPPLFSAVRRYPIVHRHRAGRMAAYLFGILPYLALSVSIRWLLLPPWNSDTHQFTQRSL